MKCPLFFIAGAVLDIPEQEIVDLCGEDCAWWDEEKNCCSVKVIAKELSRIQVKGINVQVAR